MSETPKLSRRDWFRLRSNAAGGGELGTASPDKLTQVDSPPNHDGTIDLAELPPIHEALLDAEQVTALFGDIQHYATDVSLFAGRNSAAPNLSAARQQLFAGTVRRIQVRYAWQNQNWIDTLSQTPAGIKLIRIAQQF